MMPLLVLSLIALGVFLTAMGAWWWLSEPRERTIPGWDDDITRVLDAEVTDRYRRLML